MILSGEIRAEYNKHRWWLAEQDTAENIAAVSARINHGRLTTTVASVAA
jgi:hypothetical protein